MKDPCIRQILRNTELLRFVGDDCSKIVEEFALPVAKARIDVAVVNGALHGYEIKSASDTLKRLPSQIEAYTKVFDYLSIVTEQKYYQRIVDSVPSWIGIIICSQKNGISSIKQVRKPKLNKNKEGVYLAKLLWRDELIACLSQRDILFRKKDRNWLLCEALATNLDINTLSCVVREQLKKRIDWKSPIIADCEAK